MRIHKAFPLAAVLSAIAIAASLAVVAGAATDPHAINDAATNVPPATATALAPANTLALANQGVGFCGTGPGEKCAVDWLMSKGTATATAYGSSPEGPVDGNPVRETCSSSTCTKRAVASPSPDVTVEDWIVTGPNISVICAGPTWLC
jgi:hypothetical protein